MTALILMLLSLALLTAFLLLARSEAKRGARFAEPVRARLDRSVDRAAARLQDLDLEYTVKTHAKKGGERVLHDAAHYSLIAVRWVERTLTKAVRTLRARRAVASESSAFATTMKDFGQELRENKNAPADEPTGISKK